MKIKLLLTFLACTLFVTGSYASFPVKRVNNTEISSSKEIKLSDSKKENVYLSPAAKAKGNYDPVTALVLGIFLWPLAIHRWYMGSPWYWNVLFIITFGGLTIWAMIDIIKLWIEVLRG